MYCEMFRNRHSFIKYSAAVNSADKQGRTVLWYTSNNGYPGTVKLLLKSGAKAKQGDLLQIAYISAGENFGVIFSIDGNGAVTLHYPEHKKQSTFLKKEKKVLLESAYELDDAPGFERFFFITSPAPINVDGVLKKAWELARDPNLAETANIELKQSFKQTSVLIEKGD